MKLVITDEIFELFPDVRVGVLVLRDIEAREDSPVDGSAMLASAQTVMRASLAGVPVTEHPRILCWREAYRAFGAKPKKYPSSIENLARRTLKGETLRSIHPLVDAYNVVSMKYVLPAGGEDLDAIEGDIRLTRAAADAPAVTLLGETDARAPKPGEVIYTDDVGAVCRRWNWKEADRTKLTGETTSCVLVLETLPPVLASDLDDAMSELSELAARWTGARIAPIVLHREQREAELG